MRTFLLFSFALASLAGCQSTPTTSAATTPPTAATAAGRTYGTPVQATGAVPVQNIATLVGNQDSVRTKLVGTVADVCQAKGCWMTMQTATGQPMRIRFKDYGFFVPKDISGKTAVVEGYVLRETVPVDEQRHYAQDAGKSPQEIAAITKPIQQYNFVADGVLVQ